MVAPSLQPARPATLRLAFAPDSASARAVSEAIRNFLGEQGVAEKELFTYELCIAEASNNAIEYAVGAGRELKPVAEALFAPDLIELRVTDHTPGFELPEHIPPPSPLNERGRGLFIIQSVMDEVRYLRGPQENILIMRKKRRGAPARPADAMPLAAMSFEETRRQLAEAKRAMASMAGELSFRSETLSAVFRYCGELGRLAEVSEGFGERLLVDLLHLTCADWYLLRLFTPETRQLAVTAVSEPGLAIEPILLPMPGEAAQGIEASVASTQAPVRFDLRTLAGRTEPLLRMGVSTGLVCPLCFGGTLVGTIALGRRDGEFHLGKLQDEVVRAFAEFLAIQTVNFRHHKEEVRNRVVARELEIAQEIQLLLLPRTLPQLEGFGLAGGWQSAREVGGDFYDAISLGGHSLLLMIADVMGKGVPAALFATTMRGLLRGLASRSNDPAQLLGGLNRLLYAELAAVEMFITAQIVHVDLQTRVVTSASAGHCPLLYLPHGRRAIAALPSRGLPLGVLPDTVYDHATGRLGSPAVLLLHTDGLTDMRNAAGKMFGQRRLIAWLNANAVPGRRAAEMQYRLATEINRFRGGSVVVDDQAFLLLTEENAEVTRPPSTRGQRIQFQRGSFLFPGNNTLPARP